MNNTKPLEGVHVLDLGQYISVPAATVILASWGAEVIKVESTIGDPMRLIGSTLGMTCENDHNSFFGHYNVNKKIINLNLKDPKGMEVMQKLLAWADVFATNWRPKALAKNGLDYETLHAKYPRLIWAAINGFGNYGPEKDDAGYDTVAYWSHSGMQIDQSEGGGAEGASPVIPFYGIGDNSTASTLAGAIGTGLYQREKTGEGCQIFASLYGQAVWAAGCDLMSCQYNPHEIYPKTRTKPASPVCNSYKTKDGEWINTSIFDTKIYPKYLKAVGREDLMDDPRFNNPDGATENRDEMFHIIEEGFAKYTYEEMSQRLQENDVAFSKIYHVYEVVNDEQALANNMVYPVEHRDGTTTMFPAPPATFGDKPEPKVEIPYGRVGEHSAEVLTMLGYSEAEINEMLDNGVAVQWKD